jgi:tripartite ATP-independent transporter DctM subunit
VGAGTFSAMIPPSITMVLYGLLTNESIGRILIAGIIPGILTAVVYLIGIFVMIRIKKHWAPPVTRSFTAKEKLQSLSTLFPVALVFIIIVGGIYAGIVAPASAGAIGALSALIIAIAMRKFKFLDFTESMKETAATTAILFFIVIGGLAFSRLLLVTGTVDALLDVIKTNEIPPWVIMTVIILIYLVLGCVMDSISMMVMTVPIVHPIVVGLGFDPIWFAIIMVKLIELSVITPPVGLNLYAVQSSSDGLVTTSQVFRGVTPFIILELIVLGILFLVPGMATLLPNLMIK